MAFNLGMLFRVLSKTILMRRLFGGVTTGVILGNTQKVSAKNRKVVEVGLTKLLSKSDAILADANRQTW